MSIRAFIKIEFSTFYQDNVLISLIQILLDGGWNLLKNEDKIADLPMGHNNASKLIININNISKDEIIKTIAEKIYPQEPISIILTWQDTNIGGTFIFQPNEKLTINLTLNRKTINEFNCEITDSNWYFARILPLFYENNIEVFCFSLTELIDEK